MKLMHKLTVKLRLKNSLLSSSENFFFRSFLPALRYLKMWRAELSWSSLNEHLINHPYNAPSLSFFLSRFHLSVVFVISPKKKASFFSLLRFSWSVDLLMAIKISQKINVVVPVQFFLILLSPTAASFIHPRSMVCDNG